MSSVTFKIKDSDIDKINEVIRKNNNKAEDNINEYLHKKASKLVILSINDLLPTSNRNKKHAKDVLPFDTREINLGFVTKTKKQYGYLYFPDQGEGTSKKNTPIEFMSKGVEKEYDNVVNGVIAQLKRTMEE